MIAKCTSAFSPYC